VILGLVSIGAVHHPAATALVWCVSLHAFVTGALLPGALIGLAPRRPA
jgi:hypothetical protein